ncbi:hypothetical protein CANARDRAFT_236872 [[Candida] arabinofermentans NRRL YB-2248]|uniref:EKC/KEOPS complex subunit GON7 n=1 Tax=[Candida] arabinofermentans NRRL YB-2248 TaxID=983967 RepID=A0A1E4SX14_9ASCO|nr:hypothetical protein CANARDRAFT_236872 [[Candida] arabinofermentans NRRL YB-2248]
MSSLPTAIYTSPDLTRNFHVDPSKSHTTDGVTTGPSDHVLKAGAIDKDKPSLIPTDAKIGLLRAYLTTLQDDVNLFLTKRMAHDDLNSIEGDLERRILDDGVDEDDDDDE